MSTRGFWINQILFQASWPVCVIGAAHGTIWPGALVVGVFAAWQLHRSRRHPSDLFVVGAFLTTGLVLDTLWVRAGIVEYAAAWPAPGFTPAWLLLLWVALGLTVNHSLSVFQRRWLVFIVLAAVGSPMSYSIASGLGAVSWLAPSWLVIACVGPIWGLVVGMLFREAGMEMHRRKLAAQAAEALRG